MLPRFETDLARRNADIAERHQDETPCFDCPNQRIRKCRKNYRAPEGTRNRTRNRGVEVSAGEVDELRERKHELESEMPKGGSCR